MLHGFVPEEAVREVKPRPGEYTLREEDILDILTKEGPSIALVLFSGIQYYTGQWFPMESITAAAHEQVCPRQDIILSRSQFICPGCGRRLGPRTRNRERSVVFTRLGRGLCGVVLVQIPQFGSRWYCRTLRP
jgi:hypothetical protein